MSKSTSSDHVRAGMFHRIHSWRNGERGMSSLALVILVMPLLILAFGYGFDSIRMVYLRQALQERLQFATQSAVSVTYVSESVDTPDQYLINLGYDGDAGGEGSIVRAYDVYGANTLKWRTSGQILMCSEQPIDVEPTPLTKCAGQAFVVGQPLTNAQLCATLSDEGVAKYGIKYVASEQVKLTFLRIVGFDSSELNNLTSTSLVRAQNC